MPRVHRRQYVLANEINNRYDRLVVVSRAPSKSGLARWNCRCSCGKSLVVAGTHLRSGRTKSCGCLRRDRFIEALARRDRPWNKGLTKETDQRLISIAKAASRFWSGRKHTEEHNRKISEAHKKIVNWNYKGGISPINKRIRKTIDYKLWREAVFYRDDWACQRCGTKGGKLHPHHIRNFSQYPSLRFEVDNGITLCELHHMEFHKTYGQTGNTVGQIAVYIAS